MSMPVATLVPCPARRRFAIACALGMSAPAMVRAANRAAEPHDARLAAAIAGRHRAPAARARDGARNPYETLRFFGIAPEMDVVEIAPGAGWYTEILAPYLRERGRLHAAHHARSGGSEYQRRSRERFDARLAADPGVFDRVIVGEQPGPDHGFRGIEPSGGADMVLTFRNLHNWMKAGHLDHSMRAFHGVLAPGGVLGVVEHRASPETSVGEMIDSGYMSEAFVIARAHAAGFVLEARSEVNANPRDTGNHPHGVWSLPPTLRGREVDRARFLAIGESDRMTLRFRKA
ncbi:MAG: methyltransferase [Burkholderiaceae bacterium]